MKLEDYKPEDIEVVLEMKKAALNQIEEIEKAIWTDNINEATARIARLYQVAQRLRVKKNEKKDEENLRFVEQKFKERGINISLVRIKKPTERYNASRQDQM